MFYSYSNPCRDMENKTINAIIQSAGRNSKIGNDYIRKLVADTIKMLRQYNKKDRAKWFLSHCYFVGYPIKIKE